jgi:hypothetical protein
MWPPIVFMLLPAADLFTFAAGRYTLQAECSGQLKMATAWKV